MYSKCCAKVMLNSRLLVGLVASLYPALFFVSSNWYAFSTEQLLILLLALPLFLAFILAGLSMAVSVGIRSIFASLISTTIQRQIKDCSHATVATITCFFLLSGTIGQFPGSVLVKLTILSVLTAISAFVSYKKGMKPLASLLLFLTALAGASFAINYFKVTMKSSSLWSEIHRGFNDSVEFTHLPNVYYLLTESHPNKEALQRIFGLTENDLDLQLHHRSFDVYNNAFSNYNGTLASMSSMFAMEHHYYQNDIGVLDSVVFRDIIATRSYNAVLDIFIRNGYKIQFLHEFDALLRGETPAIDYRWPAALPNKAIESMISQKALGLLPEIFRKWVSPLPGIAATQLIVDELNQHYLKRSSENPTFSFIYIGKPGHSKLSHPEPAANGTEGTIDRNIEFRQTFRGRLQRANKSILMVVDTIVEADPEGIIIVSGDHGAWGYRSTRNAAGEVILESVTTLDRLGIFLAIRSPAGKLMVEDGTAITLVNLFRYLFVHLGSDAKLLSTRVEENSYLQARDGIVIPADEPQVLVAIKQGSVLKKWEPM